jgi:hypothetical protein
LIGPIAASRLLPTDRAAALCEQVTIDLDITDVEERRRVRMAGTRPQ